MAVLVSGKGFPLEKWAAKGESRTARQWREAGGQDILGPLTHPEIPLEQSSMVVRMISLDFSLPENT